MKNADLTLKWNNLKRRKVIFIYQNGQRNFNVWQYINRSIEKIKLYLHKTPIPLGDVDIEKVLVSK